MKADISCANRSEAAGINYKSFRFCANMLGAVASKERRRLTAETRGLMSWQKPTLFTLRFACRTASSNAKLKTLTIFTLFSGRRLECTGRVCVSFGFPSSFPALSWRLVLRWPVIIISIAPLRLLVMGSRGLRPGRGFQTLTGSAQEIRYISAVEVTGSLILLAIGPQRPAPRQLRLPMQLGRTPAILVWSHSPVLECFSSIT